MVCIVMKIDAENGFLSDETLHTFVCKVRVCFVSKHTLILLHIFSGSRLKTPNPRMYAPGMFVADRVPDRQC